MNERAKTLGIIPPKSKPPIDVENPWFVWCSDRTIFNIGSDARVGHHTRKDAENEALRLALDHPGHRFAICRVEAVAGCFNPSIAPWDKD